MSAQSEILFALAVALSSAAVLGLAVLERCERHLRALHVQVLGPLDERSPDALAVRRGELGLADGYPFRQIRQLAVGWFLLAAVSAAAKYWPW